MKSTNYQNNIIKLAKSILVKCDIASVTMNKALLYKTNIADLYNPTDKKTWQYYINLSGEYFKSPDGALLQELMYITVQETGKTEILTKELLQENIVTKNELLLFGNLFDSLVNTYPENTLLLYGMLYDVDIEKAINAPDGTILTHNPYFIEEQEYSLLSLVEDSVKKYMRRWNIPEYGLVDELYSAGLISTLTNALVLFIHNVRLEMVTTYEVHSYHMESYFNSNLAIGEYVDILTKETRMWLYKNLRTLITDLGKHKTIEDVIEHILIPNNINVSKIGVKTFLPDVVTETNPLLPYYEQHKENLVRQYRDDTITLTNVETVLRMESNHVLKDMYEYVYSDTGYNRSIHERVGNTGGVDEDTKILILKLNDYSYLEPLNYNTLLIESTIEYLDKNKLMVQSYIDPNSGISYTLSGEKLILVLLYHLIHLYGIDDKYVNNVCLSCGYSSDFTTEDILNNIDTEWYGVSDVFTPQLEIVKELVNHDISNKESIPPFILGQLVAGKVLQEFMTNSDSAKHVANTQIVRGRINREVNIPISTDNKTILELLNDYNVFIKLNDNYDHLESLTVLIKSVTGLGLRVVPDDYLYKLKMITKALTSYTIQLIVEDNTKQLLAENLTPLPIVGLDIVKIVDGEVDCELD